MSDDLKTLGIISGISTGALKGLQFLKSQNEREEEEAQRKREEIEERLRASLPYASQQEAETMFQIAGIPQDLQAFYKPIIGIRRQGPKKDASAMIQQLAFKVKPPPGTPGEPWTPKRAYDVGKALIYSLPGHTQGEKDVLIGNLADRIGHVPLDTPESDLSPSEELQIMKYWNDVDPEGKKILEKRYPGLKFPTEIPDEGRDRVGRTPEEILKDQLYEVRDLVRDVDANVKSLRSAIPEAEGAEKEELKDRLADQQKRRKFLVKRRQDVRNRQEPLSADAFEKFIRQPVIKRHKKIRSLTGMKLNILRKKAVNMLRDSGYKVTRKRVDEMIEKGIVK